MSARVVASRAGYQCVALEPSRLDEALVDLAELPSQVGYASLEREPEVGGAWRLLLAAARCLGGLGARERLAGFGCYSAAVVGRPGRCSPHISNSRGSISVGCSELRWRRNPPPAAECQHVKRSLDFAFRATWSVRLGLVRTGKMRALPRARW